MSQSGIRQTDANSSSPPIAGLIGSGGAMQDVYRLTRLVARSNASVLLLGETGTGKELIAKAIHMLSPRGSGPFVRVNCGALSEGLLESELFGHVRGAFTGAIANRTGRFEAAHTGTIFLDEINSTTPKLQIKLLRVLQEREFERVGDTQTIRVDTRVVAASNRDLGAEVEAERFREDLFYRLNVVPISLPPLRKRREDIPELVAYFLAIYNEVNDRYVAHIGPKAMEALQNYDWPGNVRELQNIVTRACVLNQGSPIRADELRPWLRIDAKQQIGATGAADDSDRLPVGLTLDEMERRMIVATLEQFDGHRAKAAEALGIGLRTLSGKLREYGYAPREKDFANA